MHSFFLTTDMRLKYNFTCASCTDREHNANYYIKYPQHNLHNIKRQQSKGADNREQEKAIRITVEITLYAC